MKLLNFFLFSCMLLCACQKCAGSESNTQRPAPFEKTFSAQLFALLNEKPIVDLILQTNNVKITSGIINALTKSKVDLVKEALLAAIGKEMAENGAALTLEILKKSLKESLDQNKLHFYSAMPKPSIHHQEKCTHPALEHMLNKYKIINKSDVSEGTLNVSISIIKASAQRYTKIFALRLATEIEKRIPLAKIYNGQRNEEEQRIIAKHVAKILIDQTITIYCTIIANTIDVYITRQLTEFDKKKSEQQKQQILTALPAPLDSKTISMKKLMSNYHAKQSDQTKKVIQSPAIAALSEKFSYDNNRAWLEKFNSKLEPT